MKSKTIPYRGPLRLIQVQKHRKTEPTKLNQLKPRPKHSNTPKSRTSEAVAATTVVYFKQSLVHQISTFDMKRMDQIQSSSGLFQVKSPS